MFSFSAEKDTEPLGLADAALHRGGDVFQLLVQLVPGLGLSCRPMRITMPVIVARPTLSGGSNRFPVRTSAVPLTSGNSWSSSRYSLMPLGSV